MPKVGQISHMAYITHQILCDRVPWMQLTALLWGVLQAINLQGYYLAVVCDDCEAISGNRRINQPGLSEKSHSKP